MMIPDRPSPDADMHDNVGVYAVGALDPDQAAEFEEHLAGCVRCADELAGVQNLLSTLALLADEVSREGGPAEELRETVVRMDAFRSRRPLSRNPNSGSASSTSCRSRSSRTRGVESAVSAAAGIPGVCRMAGSAAGRPTTIADVSPRLPAATQPVSPATDFPQEALVFRPERNGSPVWSREAAERAPDPLAETAVGRGR